MNQLYEPLFEPIRIGTQTVKNRFIMCAMEGTNLIEGTVDYEFNPHCLEFYRQRAIDGVGLLIPGMVAVKTFDGSKWLYECESIFMGPVKELVDEMHQYGSKLFLQVGSWQGRTIPTVPMLEKAYKDESFKETMKSHGVDVDKIFEGPSAGIPSAWDPSIKTYEMPVSEIEETVAGFAKTALLCQRAGIDGIEIHAVHEGYLFDQFAIASINHRNDAYGGSLENRLRFITDIIRAIKAACGPDFCVSVRFSIESKMRGFNMGGIPGEDFQEFGRDKKESIKVAQYLEEAGADLLNADNGSYDSWFWAHPPVYMPLACNLADVALIKPYVSIPVACAGRMEDPAIALNAITSKQIDMIGVARQFLCDNRYLTKIRQSALDDIRPCIACHNGCFGVYRYKDLPAEMPEISFGHCALNPETFQEEKYRIKTAEQIKHITIIGGGIGGMEAARVSALRGHHVDLYEQSDELGGVFIAAAAPSYKEKDKLLLEWYKHQLSQLPITVHLNTKVSPQMLSTLTTDEIIIATGASPRRLALPGIDSLHVMEAIEYLRGIKQTGERVVIIGGGLTGCEIAYDLALKGKKPIIIEMQDDILKVKNLSAANSNMLRELIRFHQIPVYTSAALSAISDTGIEMVINQQTQHIEADSVILSTGYISDRTFGESLQDNQHIIGDASKVGNLLHVIWQAYDVAQQL